MSKVSASIKIEFAHCTNKALYYFAMTKKKKTAADSLLCKLLISSILCFYSLIPFVPENITRVLRFRLVC